MTIRQILRYCAIDEEEQHLLVDDAALLVAVYRSPGMHQVFDESDEQALTPKDGEFLHELGILQRFLINPLVSAVRTVDGKFKTSCLEGTLSNETQCCLPGRPGAIACHALAQRG